MKDIIISLTKNKAPGKGNINNHASKNLPDVRIERIKEITEVIISWQYFSKIWKRSKIILVKKSNKRSNETSDYRPISLLAAINTLREKLICTNKIKGRNSAKRYFT